MLQRAFRQLARQQLASRYSFSKKPKNQKKAQSETQPTSTETKSQPEADKTVKEPQQQQVSPKKQSQPEKPAVSQKSQSQKPKAASEAKVQQPVQQKAEPLRRDKSILDKDEFEQQDQPLQKENRNTIGWWIYRFFFWGSAAMLSYNIYLVYNHKKKTPIEKESGVIPFFIGPAKWIVNSFNDAVEFVTQPPSKKLLYDPVHPDLHPKTLVLNLSGTILKSEYVFGKGVKTTLRPGLEAMLKRLSQKYEIVIFAQEDEMSIMTKVMKIDPKQMHIRGILGRESMVWKGGEFIKDLRYLNRDLRKVVVVDRRIENVKNQPENTIIIPEFDGSDDDGELNKLTYLLQKLVDVPDVRKYLGSLGEKPVDTYYDRVKNAQEKLNKKANMFGMFSTQKPQPKESKESKDL